MKSLTLTQEVLEQSKSSVNTIDLRIDKKEFDIHAKDCLCIIDEVEFIKIIDTTTQTPVPVVETTQSIATFSPRNGISKFLSRVWNRLTVLPLTMPICLVMVLGLFGGNVWGQFSGTYTFGSNGNVTSFDYNGSAISNLTVSAITKNGVTSSSSTDNFRASNWTTGSTNGGAAGGTIDLTDYFEFTITAASGYTISNPTLNFGVGRSGTGPRRFQWRWSVDSYGSALSVGTLNASVTHSSGVMEIGDVNTGYTGNAISTTTSGQTAITFRFYAYGAESSGGTGGLQGNLTFGGTLVAAPTNYSVTFDANGGSGSMSDQTASSATNLTLNAFTRTGYTFAGWNTVANGSGTSYANGASYPFTADVTLYAQWTANTLTVTYDSQGGSAISNGSTTTGGTIAASPSSPTRSGYTFNGWFVASSGGSAISFPYSHGQTSNFTLYAQWTAAGTPTLNAVTLASALSTTYGNASAGVSFAASGSNLTGNITATAQTGYEVSTSSGSGYGASVSVASGTTVYVRFASTYSAGTYNSATAVVLSGGGAATSADVTTSSSGNTVSQKTLTITGLTAQNKVYDGLTSATISGTASLSGIVGADDVSLTGTPTYTFASANVGTGISVSTSGYSLTGAQSGNYTLTQPSFTANITVRSLTVTANDVNKYAGGALTGGAGSTAFTSSGLQNGETIGSVTITYGTGAASGDAVGTYAGSVTPSAATGGTFTASNYSITYVAGSITVLPQATKIAGWDFNGLSGYGSSPQAATNSDANVTIGGLTRASGFGTGGTAAGNAWGGTDNGTATFTVKANTGYSLSLSEISAYRVRRSGTGATTGQWAYSLDGTNFTNIGSAINWGGDGSSGNAQSAISLIGISALQNLSSATTVTFRITNTGASGSGTWYLYEFQTGDDFIVAGTVDGPVRLTAIGTAATENFDGMGTSTTLPTGWRMHASTSSPTWSGASPSVTQQASTGSPTTGGTYNWGTSASERAVGAMTSGSFNSPNQLLVRTNNKTGSTITNLSVAYTAERYRTNTANASITFYYSTNGTSWTTVADGNIATSSFPTGSSAYSLATPLEVEKNFSISGLSIAADADFYLRWDINTTGENSQGIGIDDVSIKPCITTSITAHPATAAASTCLNGTAFSALSVTATGTGLTYQWQSSTASNFSASVTNVGTNSNSYTPVNTATGTLYYRCVVTNGCGVVTNSNVSGAITVNALPTTVTVTGGGAICSGASTTLNASNGSSGTIYWQNTTSDGTSTATASTSQSISSAGTYYFRAQSAEGCWGTQGSATVSVNALPTTVTVTGGGAICSGASATLNASNGSSGTIYWQNTTSDGTSTATASTSQSISSAGTYYFRARSTEGCWGTQGSATVSVNALPTTVTVTGGGAICSGASTTLNASNGSSGTIYWQNTTSDGTSTATASTSQSISSAGTYYFRAQSAEGCWGTQGSATVSVNANQAASVSIASSDADNTICSGTSVTFTATPTNGGTPSYQWKVNGSDVGTNSNTYTSTTLANNDAVTVEMTSTATCATGSPATSNSISTTVNATGTWIGGATGDWNVAGNWCGGVPNSNSAVVSIPAGVTVDLDDSPSVLNLTIGTGATINADIYTLTIASGGALLNNGTFNGQTGTVVFDGDGTISGTAPNFNNLTLNGNLNINTNLNCSGNFTPNTSTVEFTGSSSSTITLSGSKTFYNLKINKSGTAEVILGEDIAVSHEVIFTDGNLKLNLKELNLGIEGNLIGEKEASYAYCDCPDASIVATRTISTGQTVDAGNLGLSITPAVNMGTVKVVRRHERVTLATESTSIQRSYYVSDPAGNSVQNNGLLDATLVFHYLQSQLGDIELETTLSIYRKPSSESNWVEYGGTHDEITKTVTISNWQSFSEVTLGGFNSPLPVELLSFNSSCQENQTVLSWQTASEHNSSHFDIEKSTDGTNWRVIGQVPAAGNSTELLSYSFMDEEKSNGYYRLNQIDIDGLQKYYGPISAICESINHLNGKTIPNPSNNEFWLQISSAEQQKITYILQDMNGSKIMKNTAELLPGSNMFPIRETIPSGMYFIILQTEKGQQQVIKHVRN